VISDVDGTLVTNEKALTERTRAAAAALRANGILFSLISSRPPRGLRMLTAPLGITAPIVCFSGGMQRRSTDGFISIAFREPPKSQGVNEPKNFVA
jgi:hydroxymethylpyrimidine pyrophosphatase-like HAD family hydrolase